MDGSDYPADLMGKGLSADVVERHMGVFSIEYQQGLAQVAAKLHLCCAIQGGVDRECSNGDSLEVRGNAGQWTCVRNTTRN